ncbi:hypothetical protein LWC35_26645 [Pseudonocardia kujensis]|uniref:hypothetical protein n=1 Tax=Pseudonocardia kujensis TaxID=1128675 RepID=UPI001E533D6D|nr:hypothetical protein [Pseudonocardia kujensis]MCE0766456.1 hypothetical protein [Pseudonocardia kujensis]
MAEADAHDVLFADAAAVADAVLFEGYLLYPYRASAQKNRIRWQWGVLVPQGFGTDSGETSTSRTECVVETRGPDPVLHLRLRFLQRERRTVHGPDGMQVGVVEVGGLRHVPFEEGVPRHVDATLPLVAGAGPLEVPVQVAGAESVETLHHPDGTAAGGVVRVREPLDAEIRVRVDEPPGPYPVLRLCIEVRNQAWPPPGAARDEALGRALIGTHLLLAVERAAFLSPTDPPEWAAPYVAECRSAHAWPALAGPEGRSDLLLSAPIILADHARIAPESTVDLFDGTENDELLTLRTMTLTDAEKAEARATDPRAAALLDAVDALPPEYLERLHGAIRSPVPTLHTPTGSDGPDVVPERLPWWDPAAEAEVDPEHDTALVGGVPVARGSAVVLHPRAGADAQDAFLAGLRATVQAVVHDVDGAVHVAVSVDGDPAAELQRAHGRFRYFRPDELEVVP